MKKLLGMTALTFVFTMCFGMTVFAAGSIDTSAYVVSQKVLDSFQAETSVAPATTESGQAVSFTVEASTPATYTAAANQVDAAVSGSYERVTDKPMVVVNVVPSVQPNGKIKITLTHKSIVSGSLYLVLHQNAAGAWDSQVVTGGDGALDATFTSFSPVAIVPLRKVESSEPDHDAFIYTKVDNAKVYGNVVKITKADDVQTLTISFMRKLRDANVALEMEYEYQGKEYSIYIPAGKALVDENIPYYGPLFLAAYYGGYSAGSAAGADVYTVVAGDTLGKIAQANGTSVSKIAELNSDVIKDVNYILPGMKLKLK